MALDSWSSRPSFPDSLFSSYNFSENQVLTNALLTSLSDSSNAGSSVEIRLAPRPAPRPEPAIRNPLSGRVTKRKSRASKKSPTTYITADPVNFRQMVQQLTGVPFNEPDRIFPVAGLVRPEPLRGFGGTGGSVGVNCLLPTLDTSAVLLDRASGGFGSLESGSGFGFDAGLSFPTLESWGAT